MLLRRLRDQPQQRAVLIQINDNGPRELLRFRWQAAVVSVVPELEEVFGKAARQIR